MNEYKCLLDSSNMNQRDWVKIAKDIEASYDVYDAFIVLHGTDTMVIFPLLFLPSPSCRVDR